MVIVKNGLKSLLLNSYVLSSDSYIFEGPQSEKSGRSGTTPKWPVLLDRPKVQRYPKTTVMKNYMKMAFRRYRGSELESEPNISFFLSCVEGSHSFIISRHNSLLTWLLPCSISKKCFKSSTFIASSCEAYRT